MTMRLLGAAGAIAVAMALEPTSFNRTGPQGKSSGGPAQGLTSTPTVPVLAAQTAPLPAPPAGSATLSPAGSATLSMVPVPKNPRVVQRLRAMLPPDLSVPRAAAGFHDQAQFVAAVQLSHNLDIPFAQLKAKVVGEGLSLGQALLVLRPGANVSRELARTREIMAQ